MFQGKINFPVSVQSSLGGPGLRALFVRILSKPGQSPNSSLGQVWRAPARAPEQGGTEPTETCCVWD